MEVFSERSRNTYIANRGKRRSNDRNSFSRPKKKPIYIEQQGIFSEGLNDGGKNLRAKTITSDGKLSLIIFLIFFRIFFSFSLKYFSLCSVNTFTITFYSFHDLS